MAKKLSVKKILNMDIEDINKMSKKELQKVVNRLAEEGNKRLDVFERHGESSPATRYITNNDGRFTSKKRSLNALRSEFVRAKDFLESDTSTFTKWQRVKKETLETLKSNYGIKVNNRNFDKFWKSYEKLKQLNPNVSNKNLKYMVLRELANYVKDKNLSSDEIAIKISERINDIYIQSQQAEQEADNNDVSRFFEL